MMIKESVTSMVKNLKTLRQQRKISQQKLADTIGVSQQSINKYENHKIEPDIATLIKLADYFDVTIDYLVGRTAAPDEKKMQQGSEQIFLSSYKKLTDKQKKSLLLVIENYLQTE